MIYLLDANSLIDAKRDYFQLHRVPEFWEWLIFQGANNRIKIPIEIYEEFRDAKRKDGTQDDLAQWASLQEAKQALLLPEQSEPDLVSDVIYQGYVSNPTDSDLETNGE